MSRLAFALRRPWLLIRGMLLDRDRPDLHRLGALRDPDRFVWAILPHAARTFSACIAMLPARAAKSAAIGYLYCRMLDTYEDLHPDAREREAALLAFASRFGEDDLAAPPAIPPSGGRDARDRGHLLLVERCALVDEAYATLPPEGRAPIRRLVRAMAEGMVWSSQRFHEQGGVLETEEQLLRYCRNVLGHPVVFTLTLLRGRELPPDVVENAMVVGEMIQLANVTRDIEKDLARGIAYDPRLRPLLGEAAPDEATVREVRRDLLVLALERGAAYRRLIEDMDPPAISLARASAVLMLLFTDRYFRGCARRAGLPGWDGARTTIGLLLEMAPCTISRSWTRRLVGRIETSFATAATTG